MNNGYAETQLTLCKNAIKKFGRAKVSLKTILLRQQYSQEDQS